MKANINGITKEVESIAMLIETEPTPEERLAAVEAALLEQMLGGLKDV